MSQHVRERAPGDSPEPGGGTTSGRRADQGASSAVARLAPRQAYVDAPFTGAVVPRPAVVDRLAKSSGPIAVLAPVGYGKSTILREWALADPRPFIWVTCSDDDPDGAASAIVAALEDRDPAPGALANSYRELDNALARCEPVVIVLDDVHRLGDERALSFLEHLVTAGSACTVVLSGRGTDPRMLARLRSSHRLTELGPADLALDDEQASKVVTGLSSDLAARVIELAEGWPTGLQLALLATADNPAAAAPFSGRDRYVSDLVRSEVLAPADGPTAELLMRCSLFDVVDARLCDAVLDKTGSQSLLESIEAAHLFLVPLDREHHRYRWHRLVRGSLSAELERREPEDVPEIRRRAATWFAANGMAEAAIENLLSIGDRQAAGILLQEIIVQMFCSGQMPRLVQWIEDVGHELGEDDGFVSTALAYAGMMTGDDVKAFRWGRVAADWYDRRDDVTDEEFAPYLGFRAQLCPEGVGLMMSDSTRAMAAVGELSPWRAPTVMVHGITLLLADDDAADRVLAEAVHIARESSAHPATVLALSERALLAAGRGASQAAARYTKEALAIIDEIELDDYPQSSLSFALAAAQAQRSGRTGEAADFVRRANLLRRRVWRALPWLGIQVRLVLARVAQVSGDPDTAGSLMREASDLLTGVPDSPALDRMVDQTRRALGSLPPAGRAGAALLTAAELRLLAMLPSHLSFEEIGERLHLTRNTVKTHAVSIYRKLGAASRAEAVDKARLLGLIDL